MGSLFVIEDLSVVFVKDHLSFNFAQWMDSSNGSVCKYCHLCTIECCVISWVLDVDESCVGLVLLFSKLCSISFFHHFFFSSWDAVVAMYYSYLMH